MAISQSYQYIFIGRKNAKENRLHVKTPLLPVCAVKGRFISYCRDFRHRKRPKKSRFFQAVHKLAKTDLQWLKPFLAFMAL